VEVCSTIGTISAPDGAVHKLSTNSHISAADINQWKLHEEVIAKQTV